MRSIHFKFVLGLGVLSFFGAHVVACGGDDGSSSSGGDACGPGTMLCGDACTSTAIDPDNCGACGNACADGESCDNGSCALRCSGGTTSCDGSCVDTASNAEHCGQCGSPCDAGEVCSAGQCASTCAVGLTRCGDACVDTMSDALNCGQCGNPCAGAEACAAGACAVLEAPPAVYTMTNDPAGNHILTFNRAADGSLSPIGAFTPTGGRGTGGGLGNQHGLIFDRSQNLFFAVNAGDNTISMLSLLPDGALELASSVDSGGERPVSVAVSGDVVYVVNAGVPANGTSANITGFRITGGALVPIPGSTRPLSEANPGPAQIQFNPDGDVLVVTERMTDMISTFTVAGGVATGPMVQPSAGQTPFGFDFSANGQLIVSEAAGGQPDMSSTSSYEVGADGTLTPVSGAVPTTRSAACWLVVSGEYAYVANAASDDVTGFQIGADGTLSLLDADGVTGQATDAPIDEDVTDDNQFLYVLNNASDSFSIFQINADGSLTKMPDAEGVPSTSLGIVAR